MLPQRTLTLYERDALRARMGPLNRKKVIGVRSCILLEFTAQRFLIA